LIDGGIKLQMITKEKGLLSKEMEKVIKDLELEKYSNNIQEHKVNLEKFMIKYYKNIKITELSKEKGKLNLEMSYENKKLFAVLEYIAAGEKDLGKFKLRVFDKNEDSERTIKDFEFNRMYKESLDKLFLS